MKPLTKKPVVIQLLNIYILYMTFKMSTKKTILKLFTNTKSL